MRGACDVGQDPGHAVDRAPAGVLQAALMDFRPGWLALPIGMDRLGPRRPPAGSGARLIYLVR